MSDVTLGELERSQLAALECDESRPRDSNRNRKMSLAPEASCAELLLDEGVHVCRGSPRHSFDDAGDELGRDRLLCRLEVVKHTQGICAGPARSGFVAWERLDGYGCVELRAGCPPTSPERARAPDSDTIRFGLGVATEGNLVGFTTWVNNLLA